MEKKIYESFSGIFDFHSHNNDTNDIYFPIDFHNDHQVIDDDDGGGVLPFSNGIIRFTLDFFFECVCCCCCCSMKKKKLN
mgnify:CR=1 FL=1